MMDAHNGRVMSLTDHVRQSIQNILFTRIGTRLQREEYGSLLPILLDAPVNDATLLRCNASVIIAIAQWEPRYTITQAQTKAIKKDNGLSIEIHITGSLNGKAQEYIIGA